MLNGFASRFPDMEVETTAACLRLLKVASTMMRELDLHFTAHGISQARFWTLVVLERDSSRELMPADIARQLGISKKNVARMLTLMEEDDLVTLSSHETDGRASIVRATRKGIKLLTKVLPEYYRILNHALKPLNATLKSQLTGILDAILAGAES